MACPTRFPNPRQVELLSWKSIKELTADGGVVKTVVTEADKNEWSTPNDVAEVTVAYKATLADGTLIKETQSEEFDVSAAPCEGMKVALKTMKKGERVVLELKAVPGGVDYVAGLAAAPAAKVELTLLSYKKVEAVKGTDNKVLRKILLEGAGYDKPNEGATVTVDLVGSLAGGGEFERAAGKVFKTDSEAVCDGLDRAILEMKRGERAIVTIPAEYAFGAAGREGVPGGATVVYDVTLTEFAREKESWDLKTDEEKLEFAESVKTEANGLVAAGRYALAGKRYSKALKIVEYDSSMSDSAKKTCKALKLSLHSNSALCHLKLGSHRAAADAATKALALDGSNVKALFRRGQALSQLAELMEAEADLKKVLELDEGNAEAKREMAVLKRKQREQNAKDKAVFGKMFGKLAKDGLYADTPLPPPRTPIPDDDDEPMNLTDVAPPAVAAV